MRIREQKANDNVTSSKYRDKLGDLKILCHRYFRARAENIDQITDFMRLGFVSVTEVKHSALVRHMSAGQPTHRTLITICFGGKIRNLLHG